VGGSESVRAVAQPLIGGAVARGASITEIANLVREQYGRAYRRGLLVADIRTHRERASRVAAAPLAPHAHLHWAIAQLGVAVFAITLLFPTIVYDAARAKGVLVAAASETESPMLADVALPNEVALLPRRIVRDAPISAPAAALAAVPAPAPVALTAGGPGVVVTASWYGPGFYGNRLPCWQWLAAQGQPIALSPETWGVAHKTLPCGTMVTLTHGTNTVSAPVVDRGPYVAGRELDLSPAVKAALGCTDLCTVVMQIR
jgi:hypothetical protein